MNNIPAIDTYLSWGLRNRDIPIGSYLFDCQSSRARFWLSYWFFGSDMEVLIPPHAPTWITNHFDDTYSDIPSRTTTDSRSAGRNTTAEWCTLLTIDRSYPYHVALQCTMPLRGVSSLLQHTFIFPIQTSFTHQEIVRRIMLTRNSGLFGSQVRSLNDR